MNKTIILNSVRFGIKKSWLLILVAFLFEMNSSKAQIKIVQIGNSITKTIDTTYSYRYNLWKKLIDDGLNFDFVGTQNLGHSYINGGDPGWPDYLGQPFDRDHEGHYGWKARHILAGHPQVPSEDSLSAWLQTYVPDIALVHLGHNDLKEYGSTHTTVINRTYNRLRQVVDTLRQYHPNIIILFAKIIPTRYYYYNGTDSLYNVQNIRIPMLNDRIENLPADRYDPNSPIWIVDQYTGFDTITDLVIDGIHPNELGEEKMAQIFFDAIKMSLLGAGIWTGATSDDWNTKSNWSLNLKPTRGISVIIPPIANYWPQYSGSLELGVVCNSITMTGNSELSVIGDLIIGQNQTLSSNGLNVINVEGDWINHGTFNTGSSNVNFIGTSNSEISAVGSMGGGQVTITSGGYSSDTSEGRYVNIACYEPFMLISAKVKADGGKNRNFYWAFSDGTVQEQVNVYVPDGESRVTLNFDITTGVDHRLGVSTHDCDLYYSTNSIPPEDFQIGNVGAVTGSYLGENNYYYYDLEFLCPESFYDLTVSKSNKSLSTNCDLNVLGNLTIKSESFFTNGEDNTIDVTGDVLLEADATGMASYLDNGTTNVNGTTSVQQYITSERWHYVSPPVSGATINTYYDIYLKKWNEPDSTWTYLVEPVTIPMNVTQGYGVWATDMYTGTTTVTYTGTLNTGDKSPTLSYTPAVTHLSKGFNLIGNPYPCALDWNSNWSMTDMSGWMVVYDNGVYRGQHTDGTDYNGKTDGIIPSTQGWWVRALNAGASLTIPASERLHNTQTFYKDTDDTNYPMVRLESEINGHTDEAAVIFHPECTPGFDWYYDLSKFNNIDEAPNLYTIAAGDNYAVNFYEEEYLDVVIPVGFRTGEEGLYSVTASNISNFNEETSVYLEDIKTGTVTNLTETPKYEFTYDPLDDEYRFNLHFKESWYGIEDQDQYAGNINIYSAKDFVYIVTPEMESGDVYIFDVLGQEIESKRISESNLTKIRITSGIAYYLVKFQSDKFLVTKKVFIR